MIDISVIHIFEIIFFNPVALLIALLVAGLLGRNQAIPKKAIPPLILALLAGVVISFVLPPIGFSIIILSFWGMFFYAFITNILNKKA